MTYIKTYFIVKKKEKKMENRQEMDFLLHNINPVGHHYLLGYF
jgi:hypothetical protein